MDGWRRPAIQMEAPPLLLTDGQSTRYRVGFKLQGGGSVLDSELLHPSRGDAQGSMLIHGDCKGVPPRTGPDASFDGIA